MTKFLKKTITVDVSAKTLPLSGHDHTAFMKKKLTFVIPCYNEEENVREMHEALKNVTSSLDRYDREFLFIDNASEDRTVERLRELAAADPNLKVIVNRRNYVHRSHYHAILQSRGDAVILLACDFQDPPAIIPQLIDQWEAGAPVVVGVKRNSRENPVMLLVRRFYYYLIERISAERQIKNWTGFGLYDRHVIDCLRHFNEPEPYFRGLVAELGFPIETVEFVQPKRERGQSSFNFFSLYAHAMTGFVSTSRLPLRLATFTGFGVAFFSLCVAFFYLVYKLIHWYTFDTGMAPLVLGLFFFSAVQLIFLGFLGEYVGAILTQVKNRPLVIERERINFTEDEK